MKRVYQTRLERFEYVLTEKRQDLGPIVKACVRSGETHAADSKAFAK